MAAVQVSDVVVPEVFTPYIQQLTEEKSRLVQSGVLSANPLLNNLLAGGGKTFHVPSFQDLDASDATGAESVATDSIADIQAAPAAAASDFPRNDLVPDKLSTSDEVAVRLVRANAWSSTKLAGELAGSDPMASIASRVSTYWIRRLQRIFVNTWNGVIADNLAAPTGGDQHTQNDLVNDVSGVSFIDGVTNISAEAIIDTAVTMGDSMMDLTVIMVHSTVFSRLQKNQLIDFIPDARGEIDIPTYQGKEVIVDDGMPNASNVFDTWLFSTGAAQLGTAAADVPTEIHREPLAGQGAGQDTLVNRNVWSIHPTGHAFIQSTIPNGGPSNTNLAAAANWSRVYPERKQIKFARLVTREA